MGIDQWLKLFGIVLGVAFSFGAFYEAVQRARLRGMGKRMDELKAQYEEINSRCLKHLERTAQVTTLAETIDKRLERIERKIDRINGRRDGKD